MSLGRQTGTTPGRQIETSPGRQIRMSLEWSNRISKGPSGDVGGGQPRDLLGTNFCQLGLFSTENCLWRHALLESCEIKKDTCEGVSITLENLRQKFLSI